MACFIEAQVCEVGSHCCVAIDDHSIVTLYKHNTLYLHTKPLMETWKVLGVRLLLVVLLRIF